MLAKQAWRVLKYPNSLVAKVLKNKYLTDSSFMKVKVSPISSCTWKSILSVRKLLGNRVRKVVGNGEGIDIWANPWILSLPRFCVLQAVQPDEASRLVKEVMVDGSWDQEELKKWLSQ